MTSKVQIKYIENFFIIFFRIYKALFEMKFPLVQFTIHITAIQSRKLTGRFNLNIPVNTREYCGLTDFQAILSTELKKFLKLKVYFYSFACAS
jgi:hypothetical protein